MTDPSIDAALRVAVRHHWDAYMVDAGIAVAREVLKPIRELSEKLQTVAATAGPTRTVFEDGYDVGNAFDDGVLSVLAEIAPLIYSSEELA